jgi:hypothetical protein
MSMNNEGLEVVNNVCEVNGCFEKVAKKIDVKVGDQGTISLLVCAKCVSRFEGETINA